jgi:hopanoid biosynthesis associated protein HpnK
MVPPEPARRLVVTADDFGRSKAINEAVIRAHREGILTTASLMVTGEAAGEAVELARRHPGLGVGLHLTLVCGRSLLSAAALPGLVDRHCQFDENPVRAGFRYYWLRRLRPLLRAEVLAQFDAFRRTGLELDHVDGHLHMHLHPTVFGILCAEAAGLGVLRLRVTRDPLWLNLRLASGRAGYRLLHAAVFGWLSWRALPECDRHGWRHTRRVFGLLQDGRMDEAYLSGLLARLPAGDSELYSHPSAAEFRHELEALVSSRVKGVVGERGIQLIRYKDL